ncbi:GNAT family N-acetyltransferase [Micromonospora musae]|uniref:GNAT family N-acetyltransferase n=1 Tax=Micromonospora musae TaxID=1894970 RepID=UPI0033EAF72C
MSTLSGLPLPVPARIWLNNAHVDFLIDSARVEDGPALAHTLLAAWLDTYPNRDAGIDEGWIRAHRGDVVTSEGFVRWQAFIEETQRQPTRCFCRVVRHGDEIVGFLCGRRAEAVSLGPMYMLQQAQGRGIGRQLMAAFLAWADDEPVSLWVTAYNERAISFYKHYGFEDTGERHLWRDRLPNVRMTRASAAEQR